MQSINIYKLTVLFYVNVKVFTEKNLFKKIKRDRDLNLSLRERATEKSNKNIVDIKSLN